MITRLKEMQCGTCGVWHAIPEVMYETAFENGGFWHCPNGHQRGFREGRKARDAVREERDRLKQQLAEKDDEIARQRQLREFEERRVSAAKGQITKIKKRAKAGVCPCCNRTFANMAAHMKTCHADMDPTVVDLGVEKAKRAG